MRNAIQQTFDESLSRSYIKANVSAFQELRRFGSQPFQEQKTTVLARHPARFRQRLEMAKTRLVLVEWLDSLGCSSHWQTIEQVNVAPLRCRSVGWLIHDDKYSKVIVPHVSDDDQAPLQGCGDMAIPSKSILSITELSEPKSRQNSK
jgi:hypothetical protein